MLNNKWPLNVTSFIKKSASATCYLHSNLKNTKSSLTYISSHNFKPGQRTLPPSALLKTFHLANSFRIFYLRPTFAKPQQHPGDTTPAGSDPRKFQGSTTRCPRACRTPTSPAPRFREQVRAAWERRGSRGRGLTSGNRMGLSR